MIHKHLECEFCIHRFIEILRHWGGGDPSYHIPPKSKSNGVRSGDLGGHTVGPPLPVVSLVDGCSEIENWAVHRLVERRTCYHGLVQAVTSTTDPSCQGMQHRSHSTSNCAWRALSSVVSCSVFQATFPHIVTADSY
jgi:hypothetical protein